MMRAFTKSIRRTAALLLSLTALLCSCGGDKTPGTETPREHVDYGTAAQPDMQSETKKASASVHAFIDGDTTHFTVSDADIPGGILKARYLGINTPESTGKIEEWGKTAAAFTKEKLSSAAEILLESDTGEWNVDSTGGRYLVWVWYRLDGASGWNNLNLELLEKGLAIASNSANNRYGELCVAAINQAKAEKQHVYSGEKDPNFPYGEAAELTLKELRVNVNAYDNRKVAFEGVIVKNNANTVYVEDYDAETDRYYGMTVYYGYSLNGAGLQILTVGNRVRIVGTVQYYETGGSWQVSGLEYSAMRPKDPNNIQKISEGHEPAWTLLTPADWTSSVSVEVGEEMKEAALPSLLLSTSVEMRNLTVTDIYTTDNEESSQNGAMTLSCLADGVPVSVRTVVLYDDAGQKITADAYRGKTLTVRGLVDVYDGTWQIKVFSAKDITVQ